MRGNEVEFLYEELTVWADPSVDGGPDPEPHTHNVQIDLICTYAGCPAEGPSYNSGGQPAEGPEYEVHAVRLVNPSMQSVELTETQFVTVFPDGERIIGEAVSWAIETDHGL